MSKQQKKYTSKTQDKDIYFEKYGKECKKMNRFPEWDKRDKVNSDADQWTFLLLRDLKEHMVEKDMKLSLESK